MILEEIYNIYQQCVSISTDTRHILPGQLFVALKGANFDGNKYAAQALNKGAVYALVDDPEYAVDDRYLLTDNTLLTLQQLALHHRGQLDIPVLGLTGSNGKTTTKELLKATLSRRFIVTATKGNLNNHIGVPLTILSATEQTEILLVEMGTNQPGDIELLCQIARPTLGLITNIGAAHLELLKDLDGVFREKSQLYTHVVAHNGIFFLNLGDTYLKNLANNSDQVVPYSDNEGVFGTMHFNAGQYVSGSVYSIHHKGKDYPLISNLTGTYNQENIAAALTVALHFKIPISEAISAIENYSPDNMRSEVRKTERNTIVLDAYNANPSSMKLSIEAFMLTYADQEKVLILGDMLELGSDSIIYHQEIIHLLQKYDLNNVILVGEIFGKCMNHRYASFQNVRALQVNGMLETINDAYILIKGSRGIRLETLVPEL